MKKTKNVKPLYPALQTPINQEQEDEDILTMEVNKEFSANWMKQRPDKWICPLCDRPYHKEPGPFFYGIKADKNENPNDPLLYSGWTVTVWVRALGCCGWHQSFPYKDIRAGTVNPDNIIPVLQEVFSNLQKKKISINIPNQISF